MTHQQKIFFSIVLLGAIGGGLATFIKLGVQVVPPLTFNFLRFFIATLCMLPFLLPEIRKNSLQKLTGAIKVSVFAVGNVVIFAFGVQHTTAVISSLMYVTGPVMIALLSYVLLKEFFSPRKIWGIALGLLGVVFLILLPVVTRGSQFAGTLFGNIAVLAAVVSFALYTVLSKNYQKTFSPQLLAFVFTLTTTVVLIPFVIIDWFQHPGWITNASWLTLFSVGYVGILGGAVYYLLYQSTIKRATPVIVSMTLFIQPISAYITALLLLGEKLIPGVLVGAVISVIGAWMVSTSSKKPEKLQDKTVELL